MTELITKENREQWFDIHSLSQMLGYTEDSCNKALREINENTDLFSLNRKYEMRGTRHNVKTALYNTKILEALKAYQLKAHGNTKHADIANQSTQNILQNANQMVSFKTLMESGNIDAVKEFANICIAYTANVAKTKQLEEENKQLNHALEYDKVKTWNRWAPIKKELKYKGSFDTLACELELVEGEDFERKVMGMDKYPTILVSPEATEKIYTECR